MRRRPVSGSSAASAASSPAAGGGCTSSMPCRWQSLLSKGCDTEAATVFRLNQLEARPWDYISNSPPEYDACVCSVTLHLLERGMTATETHPKHLEP